MIISLKKPKLNLYYGQGTPVPPVPPEPPVPPVPDPYDKQYFSIQSIEDYNEIKFNIWSGLTTSDATSISYSKDKTNWTTSYVDGSQKEISVPLDSGETVYFKGTANRWGTSNSSPCISSTKKFNAYGNIMSLLYGDNFRNESEFPEGTSYNFSALFIESKLVDASNLILKPEYLTEYCYYEMFEKCSYLTGAPELTAISLANRSYYQMFNSCTGLVDAPKIHATVVSSGSCISMFYGCTKLVNPTPTLPATTLADECYTSMFQGCSKLVKSPDLPASTLVYNCYARMFQGCSSISSIKCLATDISADSCTVNWLSTAKSSGTFYRKSGVNWPRTSSGIPSRWTIVDV